MNKGEIYFGNKTKHPIVFLREENSDQFIGCVLSKARNSVYEDNIALAQNHFNVFDENGEKYSVQFMNTHFVNVQLIKKNDWGPFELSGRLTEDGIQFIESHLKNQDIITWNEYIDR